MRKTLYLLRKAIDQVNPAVFLPSENQGDVVLMEESGVVTFPYSGGRVFSLKAGVTDMSLTYDDLVKKIFEYEHTVVI